jgi:hypothetical protein
MKSNIKEVELDITKTLYSQYEKHDWAMLWIELHNGFNDEDQKDWLLDQIARILLGNKIIVKEVLWENGCSELRFQLAEPSPDYINWVEETKHWESDPSLYIECQVV